MKKRLLSIAFTLCMVLILVPTTAFADIGGEEAGTNVLADTQFADVDEDGSGATWQYYLSANDGGWAGENVKVTGDGAGTLELDFAEVGGGFSDAKWGVQIYQTGVTLLAGTEYIFSFDVTSTGTKSIEAKFDEYEGLLDEVVQATAGTSHYCFTIPAPETDISAKFLFAAGWFEGDDSQVDIKISNLSMIPKKVSVSANYLDETGTEKACTSATEVTSSDTTWSTGWYVVTGNVIIGTDETPQRVTVSGDVHLILTDGCTLTVNGGIQVQDDDNDITNGSANALTIYAQSTDKSTMGKLIATGAKRDNNAVIGGNGGNSYGGSCGTIIINGGTVTATSTGYGAAIGGGYGIFTGGSGGTITINGGNINASNQIGAGIGGGEGGGDGGSGGEITINGGSVIATGGNGAGIGGGQGDGHSGGGSGGNITINGGTVTATSTGSGAGIGGGYSGGGGTGGDGGKITITGGNTTARGYYCTAIGSGYGTHGGIGGEVTITGGTVTATGGTVTATGGTDGTFETTGNGNAVIFASSIGDQSGKTSNAWHGIIFEGDEGKVYGTSVTPIEDFTIGSGKTLTIDSGKTLIIPESVTLTVAEGGALTNSGAIYVDGALSSSVGGTVYYPLTLTNCTGGENTSTVSGKTYGKVGQTVRLTATLSENQLVTSWQVPGEKGIPTAGSYVIPSMPAHRVFATAKLANALTVTSQPTGGTVTYGDSKTLSAAVSKHSSVTGELTYQWYEGSAPIDGATESDYTTPTDLGVGDHTYTCVITCGAYTVTCDSATVTVNPLAETAPNISIDYENETLTGFVSGSSYTVDGTAVTPVDGKLSVVDYIGSNISIVTKASDSNHADSTAQTLSVPARPDAPAAPTVNRKSSGSVTLNDIEDSTQSGAKAQYSMDGGETWQDSPTFTGLKPSTRYRFVARYGETDNSFASPVSAELKVITNAAHSNSSIAYPPTVEQPDAGGSVSISPKNPEKGDKVTVTPKPDEGYAVEQVTVTDKSGNPVAVTDNGDGTYSFTQPVGKVTVKVLFKDATVIRFADVPADAYYYNAVQWAVKHGLTYGTSDTAFSPDDPCTRAQVVTLLWRAAGSPVVNYAMNFSDVPADAYYTEAVRWAVSLGITKGTSATTFSPDAVCTRAQFATFLWHSQGKPAAGTANPFTDVAEDTYYTNAVLWAAASGITEGTSSTTFSPDADCTRAQVVTFLYRCLSK